MKFELYRRPFWGLFWPIYFSFWACASFWEAYAFVNR